jgi:hypothetical protein
MVPITDVSDIAQAIGNAAVVLSLLFLYRQTKLTREQAEDARIAQQEQVNALQFQVRHSQLQSQGQNIFALVDYLERHDHLRVRNHVASLDGKPFRRWDRIDLAAADTVARIYQIASALQFSEVVPPKWVHIQYGGPMLRCWEILKPYIDDLRARTDVTQRRDYESLCNELECLGWYDPKSGQLPPIWSSVRSAGQ